MKKQKVFVGLSGGVDSSVAALRLKRAGYDVTGVFIKVWHPDFLVCNWEAERLDAMRAAAHLDIPFLTCDAEAAYRDEVAKYFISEYIAGRTPNPDVMCNKHVKFGAFIDFAKEHGADYIATGHYAQKKVIDGDEYLCRGVDSGKDQSYFLYSLTKEQLAYALLPVGNETKVNIRKEAAKARLPVAFKKDSQGVCFLGHIDIKEFISHYTDLKVGDVLNKAGEKIGTHEGALIYTVGQRHGFTISTKDDSKEPYYVVSKNIFTNTIVVSQHKPKIEAQDTLFLTGSILRHKLAIGDFYQVQTRYRQEPFSAQLLSVAFDQIEIKITKQTEAVAKGQSCVLYQDELCLGGGIIS